MLFISIISLFINFISNFEIVTFRKSSIQDSKEGFYAAYCYIFPGLYKIRQCLVNSFKC